MSSERVVILNNMKSEIIEAWFCRGCGMRGEYWTETLGHKLREGATWADLRELNGPPSFSPIHLRDALSGHWDELIIVSLALDGSIQVRGFPDDDMPHFWAKR